MTVSPPGSNEWIGDGSASELPPIDYTQLPELSVRAQPSPFQITQHKIFPDIELDFSCPLPCGAMMRARLVRLSTVVPPDAGGSAAGRSGGSSHKKARTPHSQGELIEGGFDHGEFHSAVETAPAGSMTVGFRKLFLRTIADIKGPHSKVHLGFKDLFCIEIVTEFDDPRLQGTLRPFRTGAFEILSHSKQLPADLAEAARPRIGKMRSPRVGKHSSSSSSSSSSSGGHAGRPGTTQQQQQPHQQSQHQQQHQQQPHAGVAGIKLEDGGMAVSQPDSPGYSSGSYSPGVYSPVSPAAMSPQHVGPWQVPVAIKGPPIIPLGLFELPHAEATFADLRQQLIACSIPSNFRFWHSIFEGQIRPHKENMLKVLPAAAADEHQAVLLVYEDLLSLWPSEQHIIKVDELVRLVTSIHGHSMTPDDVRWVEIGMTDFFLNKGSSPTDIKKEDFRLFLQVFGGLDHCLTKLVDLYSSPVFHGFLRAEAADELLRDKGGYYMFRFSERYLLEGSLAFHINRRKPGETVDRIETFGLFYKQKAGTYALRHADGEGIVSNIREFTRKFAKKLGRPLLNDRILPADMKWKYDAPEKFLKDVATETSSDIYDEALF